MLIEAGALNFKKHFGEMLKRVQYRQASVIINKNGEPVAVLIDIRLFERIRRLHARFDALCERVEAGFAETREAQGIAEISSAVEAERAQLRVLKLSATAAR